MLLIGAILLALFLLPDGWALPVVLLAAIIEIGETLFWVWLSRRRSVQMGPETLVGATGKVVSACTPLGQVRVGGELWRARCEEGAEPGDRVRVRALSDLTLVVERAKIDT